MPDTMLSVAVFVEDVEETAPISCRSTTRENGHRRATACCSAAASAWRRVIDLPWQEDDPEHLERARAAVGRVMLAGGLAADNVRAAIEAVRPWAVDASSRLEASRA